MAMALKQDVVTAQIQEGICKPIDLVHLSSQTMGDQALEAEVLGVFASQSQIYMNLLHTSTDEVVLHRAAHSLKGAARGIGAFSLAVKAEFIEQNTAACKQELALELDRALEYVAILSNRK